MVVYYLSSNLVKCILHLLKVNKLTFAFYIENHLHLLNLGQIRQMNVFGILDKEVDIQDFRRGYL